MRSNHAAHHRVAVLAILAALLFAGCPFNPTPCEQSINCDRFAGGMCLAAPTGHNWCAYPDPVCPDGLRYSDYSGDGLASVCVGDSNVDAGVDAMIDAPLAMPVVDNGQPADLVIGQAAFESEADRGFTAQSIFGNEVAAGSSGVWIGDYGKGRVLAFTPAPTANDAVATLVVGRPTLTDGVAVGPPSAANLSRFQNAISVGGNVLAVADTENNRVLIWNPVPTTSGEPADLVIGQPNMTTSGSGKAANQLLAPVSVWTDGTRLVVADAFNFRVLIWNTMPTINGQAADIVLGQTGFGMNVSPLTPTRFVMSFPSAVYSDGQSLFVADQAFGRVMVWSTFPTVTNAGADFVLGQATPDSAGERPASAFTLRSPNGVVRFGNALMVSDRSDNRVVIYQPMPRASGTPAALVLGQPDLQTPGPATPQPPTQRSLDKPEGLAVWGSHLYVADGGNRRVVRYTLRN